MQRDMDPLMVLYIPNEWLKLCIHEVYTTGIDTYDLFTKFSFRNYKSSDLGPHAFIC